VITPSGIVLPGKESVALKEVVKGLYIAVNPYVQDSGYFSRTPLYECEHGGAKREGKKAPPSETISARDLLTRD